MSRVFNYERAALVLVEAAFLGDVWASENRGVSVRSIDNYRRRLNTDTKLSELFEIRKQLFLENWIESIPAAMRSGIEFLIRATREADPKDPAAIHAVAGALKLLAEIELTKKILDVKLKEYNQLREADRPPTQQMVIPPRTTE